MEKKRGALGSITQRVKRGRGANRLTGVVGEVDAKDGVAECPRHVQHLQHAARGEEIRERKADASHHGSTK